MTDQVDQGTGNETPAEGIEVEVVARVKAEQLDFHPLLLAAPTVSWICDQVSSKTAVRRIISP